MASGAACGQSALVAARRHGADEDAVVEGVSLHPDPVSEDGSARERRRGVDGQHPDPAASRDGRRDQAIGERRFARARRPRDPDDMLDPGAGTEGELTHLVRTLTAPFDEGEQAADGTFVARLGRVEEGAGIALPGG